MPQIFFLAYLSRPLPYISYSIKKCLTSKNIWLYWVHTSRGNSLVSTDIVIVKGTGDLSLRDDPNLRNTGLNNNQQDTSYQRRILSSNWTSITLIYMNNNKADATIRHILLTARDELSVEEIGRLIDELGYLYRASL